MTATVLALVVAAVVVLVGGTVLMVRRRRRVWLRFAALHGLEAVPDSPAPVVRGRVDGFSVRLRVTGASSDTGWLGVEEVRLEVQLDPAELPEDMEVRTRIGLERDDAAVATGDELIDRRLLVFGDRDRVTTFLTRPRRTALGSLAALAKSSRVGLSEGWLWLEERRARSRLAVLEEHLQTLLAVARGLAADDRGP